MYAYAAVLEALFSRERTGEGAAIDASLFGGMADWMAVPLLHYDYGGTIVPRVGLSHPSIHPYGAYETMDGAPILISIQNEREFRNLCRGVLGDPELPRDPRFASNVARVRHKAEFDEHMNAVFGSVPRAELIKRLRRNGIAFGEVNDVAGLSKHPALRRTTVDTPTGPANIPAPPARHDKAQRALRPVPAVGQHSAAIRREFGG
jgi:crotonobetainyl-CoA:carnitine CoA-transferase CaiB-like acyl-CoA transferase